MVLSQLPIRLQATCGKFTTLARRFTVLALESSADDTCAAVVNSSREIRSNIVVRQHDLHEGFGGIHPMVAIEAHQRNMPGVVNKALIEAGIDVNEVNGVAFTRGPGIGGCLSVGSNAAKTLAAALKKPLVGVHHMQAHALTPLLTSWPQIPVFPFLALLISGGHTLLLLVNSPTSLHVLAMTADESIGRSFDKVSRLLELKWAASGPGTALEQFCAEAGEMDLPDIPALPMPMPSKLAFSYAALHSYVERYIFSLGGIQNMDPPTKLALARAFQTAAVAQLEDKLLLALKWCSQKDITIRHVVASGGVASNLFLRKRLQTFVMSVNPDVPISMVFPPPSLCTDNAAMIGWASMHRFLARDYDDYTIDLRPKWNLEELSNQ